ncbi:MAG: hypothetical protein ACO3E4_05645 [Candidatus Nanopelagicaceae bacterium]
MASETTAYDRRELRSILGAFKAMDQEAIDQARKQSSALAEYAANEIKAYSLTRIFGRSAVSRIVQGVRISKSSKVGEFSYGFASQRFSGGATTRDLWAGYEFGSNRYSQFPRRTPSKGRGNAGYFIYPTLRKIQPELVKQWQEAFSDILKKWNK